MGADGSRQCACVINDTADFYHYFVATPHAEFLCGCIEQAIVFNLPQEAQSLSRMTSSGEALGRSSTCHI
jgi:hypothetical protein